MMAAHPHSGAGGPLPLLEREAPLARLSVRLESAAHGQGATVLVSGEAGIGKSSMLARFAATAGPRVLRGGCEALDTPRPLGPLHDIAAESTGTLGALLSREPVDRARLFSAVVDELRRSPGPAVLLIEDLHWADAATLDLVKYLARRMPRLPALLVISARDDEAARATLRPALAGLDSMQLERIPLAPLSESAVAELAAGTDVDPADLYRSTGGNPFFVSEVLRAGGAPNHVPPTVRDAVLYRLERLDPHARRLLEVSALVPRQVEIALLDALLGPQPQALDACAASGLVELDAEWLRFRHELARVAVETSVPPARSAAWHARILAVLADWPVAAGLLARLSHHARGANDAAAVLRWAPAAAAQAAAGGALREAAAHARAALRRASRMPAAAHAMLLEEHAAVLFELNELEAAADTFREAIRMHAAAGDSAGQVRCLSALAMPLVRSLRNQEADQASQAALALAQQQADGRLLARAWATESYLRMLNRDCDAAVDAGRRAISLADPDADRELVCSACKTVGSALLFSDPAQGAEWLGRSLEIARTLRDGGIAVAEALLMQGTAAGELYRFETAERLLDEAIEFATAHDLDRQAHYMAAWQALCDLYRGRWDRAGERAHRTLSREPGSTTARVMALVALGRLRVRRGDPGAQGVLDEALALAGASGTLQRLAPVCAARSEAAWLRGDTDGVAREAARAFDLAVDKRHAWYAGELGWWLQQAGSPPADVPDGATPFSLQRAGRWHEAAAAWAALGCPYEQARSLSEGDAAAQRLALGLLDGLGARPLADRLRARMRAAGVTSVPRGPIASTRGNPAGLTRREVEVLQLLAQGLATPQIASRLSRSARTVDHHVEALCAKLGVRARADAVHLGRRLGVLPPAQPGDARG